MSTDTDKKIKPGTFQKGHPFYKSQNGIKNGAKKTIVGEVKDALKLAEDAMPAIIGIMINRANDPTDKDSQRASEYLCDRIYGKSNQPISGGLTIIRVIEDGNSDQK